MLFGSEQIEFAARPLRLLRQLIEQQGKAAGMTLQGLFAIAFGIGQQLQRQFTVLADVNGDLQIAHRPGRQLMGDAFHASEIELVVKHLQVDHRTVQRVAIAEAAEIALHLFGVIALMTTHLFHFTRQLGGERADRLRRIVMDCHRQYVDHRTGGAQGGRADAAHKDEASGKVVLPAETCQPQRHQRKGEIGRARVRMLLHQRLEGAAIQRNAMAQQIGAGVLTGERQRRERSR